jgi:CHAD domain-containing protein
VDGLGATTPLGVAARSTLAVRLHDVRAFEPRVLRHRDADTVHDMRVATRRLRAALGLFGGDELEPATFEVKRLTRALGEVRDLDVQIEWLTRALDDKRAASEQAGVRVLLEDRQARLRKSERTVVPVIERWAKEAAPRVEQAIGTVEARGRLGGTVMRRRLQRRLERLEPLIEETLESADPRSAHKLRIAIKKLRYHAELLEPALPEPVGAILQALVPLQEELGALHDHDVRVEFLVRWLVDVDENGRPGAIALLRGELEGRDRLAAELHAELSRWQSRKVLRSLARPLQ